MSDKKIISLRPSGEPVPKSLEEFTRYIADLAEFERLSHGESKAGSPQMTQLSSLAKPEASAQSLAIRKRTNECEEQADISPFPKKPKES